MRTLLLSGIVSLICHQCPISDEQVVALRSPEKNHTTIGGFSTGGFHTSDLKMLS